jgi:hypothetical protein
MRRSIWTKCFSSIPADQIALDPEEDVDEFIRDEVNGREIANCVGTARTLARFRGEPLSAEHVNLVLSTRREFDKSIKAKRAKKEQKDRDGLVAGSLRAVRRDTLEFDDD